MGRTHIGDKNEQLDNFVEELQGVVGEIAGQETHLYPAVNSEAVFEVVLADMAGVDARQYINGDSSGLRAEFSNCRTMFRDMEHVDNPSLMDIRYPEMSEEDMSKIADFINKEAGYNAAGLGTSYEYGPPSGNENPGPHNSKEISVLRVDIDAMKGMFPMMDKHLENMAKTPAGLETIHTLQNGNQYGREALINSPGEEGPATDGKLDASAPDENSNDKVGDHVVSITPGL